MLRSPRNQTLRCDSEELLQLQNELTVLNGCSEEQDIINSVINQDIFAAARFMPKRFADLLILDPPYNLSKNYNGNIFRAREKQQYLDWYDSMLRIVFPLLKPDASVYVCADWKTSIIIAPLLEKYFYIQNRITWEREKGRGAKKNWKNNMEDIWLCTVGKQYTFNVDAVKIKRKVIAPYRQNGIPKDWKEEGNVNYRITYPSNLWTDISIPFWSMQENTDHPTQKPEKLIAKAILASSNVDDVVLDPFAGSGTTAVAAKKLGRRFVSVEIDKTYCCWCIKRLRKAELDKTIQGYADGVFLERNFLQKNKKTQSTAIKKWETLL